MASLGAKKKGKKGKSEESEEVVLLGRPGNNVKMGIVGLPNVGKSLLFNILTGLSVESANRPFVTIEPTTAQVAVPDKRYDFLCDNFSPKSRVPASLTVTDIAGLMKGASKNTGGIGNEFLSNISAVDGIFHVVRAFENEDIQHVEGKVDPIRDLGIISDELREKDLSNLEKTKESKKRVAKANDKVAEFEAATLEKMLAALKDGQDIRSKPWTGAEIPVVNAQHCLTAKPVVFLVNMGRFLGKTAREKVEAREKVKAWIDEIQKWITSNSPGSKMIRFNATYESQVAECKDPDEREKFIAASKNGKPRIKKMIHSGYSALKLIHYFTCGKDEVKCWTIREGTNARKAAGVIHTDFEKMFIRAEVMSYENFEKYGSENAVKAAGAYKTEGKDYIVNDGDIMLFKHNAGGAKSKKK